jgi:hypothetical protein
MQPWCCGALGDDLFGFFGVVYGPVLMVLLITAIGLTVSITPCGPPPALSSVEAVYVRRILQQRMNCSTFAGVW